MQPGTGAAPRATAARAVDLVLTRRCNLDEALGRAGEAALAARDRSLCRALAFGTLRQHERNRFLIGRLVDRPLRPRDHIVEALLSVGLFGLTETDQPTYAVVSATVDAAAEVDRAHLRGVVNAVLRRFLRERDDLLAAADGVDTAKWRHPAWLLEMFRADWPQHWEQIVTAGNRQAPMWLRVNTLVRSRADWIRDLPADIRVAAAPDWLPGAVCLAAPVAVNDIPGFATGIVSVQDAASQFAAELLDAGPRMRVLDACAAPGGKTGHILERCADLGELVAVDIAADRLERVRANLTRLRRHATLVTGDLLKARTWWDRQPFDRILLDVPCSATGVIRRHPDIRYLREPRDIRSLASRQRRMLSGAWEMLRPGGRLLYSTCSVLRAENDAVVDDFLAATPDARAADIPPGRLGPDAQDARHGVQLLPGPAATDGFYYALMTKAPD
jgi:16S rRNA (cytosine967-C5)-methyltransferase